jgi:stage II sporulation protein D
VIAAALVLTLAAGAPVAVDVLTREAPRSLVVRGEGKARSVAARGQTLLVDGAPAAALSLPHGTWRVEPPSGRARTYAAALTVRAREGRLAIRAVLALEDYVAAVVASESLPGTPPAALEALAVAVRSYALAARDRHPGGALCDLAHCQVLRGEGISPERRARAVRAARATTGEVLVLPSGAIAAAAFHAACGGRTAEPSEVFGSKASGGRPAEDGCAGPAWRAVLPPERVASAATAALGGRAPGAIPASLHAADLVLERGTGGWISAVEAADGSWRVSGDAFARALDAEVGRGLVRSGRFEIADEGGRVVLRGTGHGHGVGLCQQGAARLAAEGADRRAILGRYYHARVTTVGEVGALAAGIAR